MARLISRRRAVRDEQAPVEAILNSPLTRTVERKRKVGYLSYSSQQCQHIRAAISNKQHVWVSPSVYILGSRFGFMTVWRQLNLPTTRISVLGDVITYLVWACTGLMCECANSLNEFGAWWNMYSVSVPENVRGFETTVNTCPGRVYLNWACIIVQLELNTNISVPFSCRVYERIPGNHKPWAWY